MKNPRTLVGLGALVIVAACGSSSDPQPHPTLGADSDSGTTPPVTPPEGGGTTPEDGGKPLPDLPAPPATWKEHWFDHTQLIKLAGYNNDVAVYFDDDVDKSKATWILPYMTRVWQYTKKVYGNFGPENRLYAIFHKGRYGGGHPSTYFDESHDFRNVIDCGYDDWDSPDGWRTDGPTHEVGHIVEIASYEHHESPGFDLWHDSKWIEIYQHDVYTGIGSTDNATRWFGEMMANDHTDSFPVDNARWFRNWYYPIWKDHGGSKTLARFFSLLAQHFPSDDKKNYIGSLNWGEYVHFMSGAAQANLKPLATSAFGWPADWEAQYKKARTDFSAITY